MASLRSAGLGHCQDLLLLGPWGRRILRGMSSNEQARAIARLRLALDLFRTGEDLMRQKLRRQHPAASEQEIEARLAAWLQERPGADAGDLAVLRGPWVPRSKAS